MMSEFYDQRGAPRPASPPAGDSHRAAPGSGSSPHTVRITACGSGFDALRMNEFTDKYAKMISWTRAWGSRHPTTWRPGGTGAPPDQQPVTRTYTLRRADVQRQQLAIDFVVHGEEGIAAPWAAHAEPGDILTLSGALRAPTIQTRTATGTCSPGTSRVCPRSAPPSNTNRASKSGQQKKKKKPVQVRGVVPPVAVKVVV